MNKNAFFACVIAAAMIPGMASAAEHHRYSSHHAVNTQNRAEIIGDRKELQGDTRGLNQDRAALRRDRIARDRASAAADRRELHSDHRALMNDRRGYNKDIRDYNQDRRNYWTGDRYKNPERYDWYRSDNGANGRAWNGEVPSNNGRYYRGRWND